MTRSNYIERKMQEFDDKFGKNGSDSNCDSIGRKAGCDDCYESNMIRNESREYLHQSLISLAKEISGEIENTRIDMNDPQNAFRMILAEGTSIDGQAVGWNRHIDESKSIILRMAGISADMVE